MTEDIKLTNPVYKEPQGWVEGEKPKEYNPKEYNPKSDEQQFVDAQFNLMRDKISRQAIPSIKEQPKCENNIHSYTEDSLDCTRCGESRITTTVEQPAKWKEEVRNSYADEWNDDDIIVFIEDLLKEERERVLNNIKECKHEWLFTDSRYLICKKCNLLAKYSIKNINLLKIL